MSVLTLIAGFVSVALALGQDQRLPTRAGPVGLVFPIPNNPLSVQQFEERTQILPDGTSTTETLASHIYRDHAGRERIEWSVPGSRGELAAVIYLIDPVASSSVILLVEAKIADRVTVPRSSSRGFDVGFPAVGKPLPAGTWRTKTEELGTRVIDGVEVEGTRIVQTSDDRPSLAATQEKWFSSRLGLMFSVDASGPNWKHTAKLQNMAAHEPDPALFAIPADYTIQDR